MKKLILFLAAAALGLVAEASSPLWLRNTAISPDASQVAFTYKGDLYTVPSQGGKAKKITSGGSYNTSPVWSPDGSLLAFVSDREGSDDIFVVDSEGGTPRRVTTFSGAETPRAFLNDSTIIFDARIMPSEKAAMSAFQNQTYTVGIDGGRVKLLYQIPTLAMDVNADGDILYRDRKGVENTLRKHERSSGPSDIWLVRDGNFVQLTDFNGMDADPAWGPDDTFFYTSEEGNNVLNVFSRKVDGTQRRQLTDFPLHPVRSLSSSDNGTLAFSQDGSIYVMQPGGEPRMIEVEIMEDLYDNDAVKRYLNSGASNIAVSPTGEEVAFIIRGDIYVTNTKYKTTKRITDTPGQERCMDFSPDGRTLVYDSERDGKWAIYTTSIKDPNEKSFAYATALEEKPLYSCATAAQQPEYSPDGKKVAFLEDRTILQVIDVADKKVNTALGGDFNYSYSDGDIPFEWSPDSKWLLVSYMGNGGWNNVDVALVKADGSETINLTESGYANYSPQWALDGKGVTFMSGRYGYKNQASWGEQHDIILMVLDPETWDKFNFTEEEAFLASKEEEDKNKEKEEKADKKKKDKKDKKDADAKKEETKDLVFDLDNRKFRTSRLTGSSGFLGGYYLDKKGEKIYYQMANPKGDRDLYVRDLKKGETKVFYPNLRGGFLADDKGENLFVLGENGISKISLADGSETPIEFDAYYTRTPSAEREYIYDHMLSQVRDKFYQKDLHGVDWELVGKEYRKQLPYIDNSRDFSLLLSEVLGELNASHTGSAYYSPKYVMPTANLGAFFDQEYDGDGLKVAEIVARGPLSKKNAEVAVGDIITEIDDVPVKAGDDYFPLLEGKEGKKVRLAVKKNDGKIVHSYVRPIGQAELAGLLYDRWVKKNQDFVDSISGGRIAYVHVKDMDSESYRRVYDELLGKYRGRDAVVVDTRFNGGGWLHNDLVLLLSGKEYVQYKPRGRYIGSEPWSQWNKPSVMLVNEGNYSDAHGTPVAYQTLGVGKVVGSPVPGTMTAVWWENQIDPSIIFGIPQVTNMVKGEPMENHQLNPDVLIYNHPNDLLKGEDSQLRKAVETLLGK